VRDPHVMPKTRKALARYILSRRKQRYDAVIACYPAGLVWTSPEKVDTLSVSYRKGV